MRVRALAAGAAVLSICLAVIARADVIVFHDGTRAEGTIANHEVVAADPLGQSHIGFLADEDPTPDLSKVPVTDINYVILIDAQGWRRVIEFGAPEAVSREGLDAEPTRAPTATHGATTRSLPNASPVYTVGRSSFGPRVGLVLPAGDLSDSFDGGFTLGGEMLFAVEPSLSVGVKLSHTTFSPEQIFDDVGLDLDLRIVHIGLSLLGTSAPGPRIRFVAGGGFGLYRSQSSLKGDVRDLGTGAIESYDLDETTDDLGVDLGIGLLLYTKPRSPAIRIMGSMQTLFDKEKIGGEYYGPTRYFRLSMNLDIQQGFD